VVICLERCADLHMALLMPLPLTVSCFSKIQIGFTFLLPAHPGSPGQKAVNTGVCVCVLLVVMIHDAFVLEVCMGMGKTGIPRVPWDSHGNGCKISHGMGMGLEWELTIKCMGMGVKTWELSPATVNSLLFLHSNMEQEQ